MYSRSRKIFPKVIWKNFSIPVVINEKDTIHFLPPAAYHRKTMIIMLNSDVRVAPKGTWLFEAILHELCHHIVNIFKLPIMFDFIFDVITDIEHIELVKRIYSKRVKPVFKPKHI